MYKQAGTPSQIFRSRSTAQQKRGGLNVADLLLEVLELLLDRGVLLGHLLELGLPLIAVLLECLDFAFEVAGLDISLTEPVTVLVP